MGLLITLTLPRLVQDGMFLDGVMYAAIARNLAYGIGSFWHPYFSEAMFPFFHQQPPLTFGIESLFFRVLGDSIYVERLYSFLTLLISALLISYLWRIIYAEDENVKSISWLPIVLWIIIPVCMWSYSSNLEENTMGIFCLLSVIFSCKGLKGSRNYILLFILAGITASLAFLCKGFPGLFVTAVPFLYWLFLRSFSIKKMVVYSFIIIGTIALIYAVLLSDTVIRNSLFAYLNDRVVTSIEHVSTVGNRLEIIGDLFFKELVPPILLCIILLILFKWKSVPNKEKLNKDKNMLFLFLFIGFSASLPLIITKEQRGMYLVTSLPYYAIAFSITICYGISELIKRIKIETKEFNIFKYISIAFVAGIILYCISLIGKTGRTEQELHDVYVIKDIIPKRTTIRVFDETWFDFDFQNNMVRYCNVYLANDTNTKYKYFLVERSINKIPPPNYSKIFLNTLLYDLYVRMDSNRHN